MAISVFFFDNSKLAEIMCNNMAISMFFENSKLADITWQ